MSRNTQIDAYRKPREIKQHQKEMLDLIACDNGDFSGYMLDIGCATGAFIGFANDRFPNAKYVGVDIASDLVTIAKQNHSTPNCSFVVASSLEYSPPHSFDVIVASGVLGTYEDFTKPLETWLSWLADSGTMYIFGRFNSRDIDTIIKYRNNFKNCDWEIGMTSYSIHTVGKFLSEKSFEHQFKKFQLQIDISEDEDPIRTYTVTTTEGERMVVNGANIVAEHYFLTIRPQRS